MLGALLEVRMSKNCTPLWQKAHFEVKMLKTGQLRTTFWSSDVEKLHAVVARSILWSQNFKKKLRVREHFLKFWCRKIARHCGEKHIIKSECTKRLMAGALFEVLMSKNCMPLWPKAHYQVRMHKTPHGWSTFWSSDVEKLHAVAKSKLWTQNVQNTSAADSFFWSSDVEKLHAAVAKSTFWSQNVQNTSAADSFLKFWCRKIEWTCGEKRICQSRCTKYLCFGALFQVQMSNDSSGSMLVSQSISQLVNQSVSQLVSSSLSQLAS